MRAEEKSSKVLVPAATVGAGLALSRDTRLSPAIVALHAAGAVRGLGADGMALERLHALAETVAKIEVSAGFVLLALHVITLRRSPPEKPA